MMTLSRHGILCGRLYELHSVTIACEFLHHGELMCTDCRLGKAIAASRRRQLWGIDPGERAHPQ